MFNLVSVSYLYLSIDVVNFHVFHTKLFILKRYYLSVIDPSQSSISIKDKNRKEYTIMTCLL